MPRGVYERKPREPKPEIPNLSVRVRPATDAVAPPRELAPRRKNKEITDIDRYVGDRIRALRKAADLSQTALGEKLQLTFQQVQKYEKGTNRVSAGKLWLIAELLGAPLLSFFPPHSSRPEPDDPCRQLALLPHGTVLARLLLRMTPAMRYHLATYLAAIDAEIKAYGDP